MIRLFKRNKKLKVTKNNEILSANGIYFSALATMVDGTYEMIVSDDYMKAPKFVKDFIYWHEVGHIYYNKPGRPLHQECLADRYALQHVGKTRSLMALQYMWCWLAKIDVTACADIPSRMKELGADVSTMYIRTGNGTILYEPDLKAILERGDRV